MKVKESERKGKAESEVKATDFCCIWTEATIITHTESMRCFWWFTIPKQNYIFKQFTVLFYFSSHIFQLQLIKVFVRPTLATLETRREVVRLVRA